MTKKSQIILYILIAFFQIIVISNIILQNNNIVKNGTELSIKVLPIDPYDAFRGKYLNLNINRTVKKNENVKFAKGSKVYATFKTDENNFSEFDTVSIKKPKNKLYIKVIVERNSIKNANSIIIKNPFAKFYIEEKYSKEAEKIYRENVKNKDIYIKVKILHGRSVIEEIYIDNETIKNFIKRNAS